jgi:hypothetical protein
MGGGKQTRMHDTVIQCEQGYLGPFVRQLKVGDTQSMVWLDGDAGPYWMSAEERESNRKDHYGTKTRTRDFTKDVLIRKLAEKGVEGKGNSKQVQAMCVAHNIPTKYTETEVKEGWEGKAKGMEQILWERGWIDGNRPRKDYSKLGTKDSMGLIRSGTSLLDLVANCSDFEMKRPCCRQRARRWECLLTGLQNATASLRARESSTLGGALKTCIGGSP